MSIESTRDQRAKRLRRQAELALGAQRKLDAARRSLEALLELSVEGDDNWAYAERRLAELDVEHAPWQAALRLRRLQQAGWNSADVEALLGLAFAVLGNFQAAVSAYRRACRRAPDNAWYRHNIGHLLDVGLGLPEQAKPELERAVALLPQDRDVRDSLRACAERLKVSERRRTAPSRTRQSTSKAVGTRRRNAIPSQLRLTTKEREALSTLARRWLRAEGREPAGRGLQTVLRALPESVLAAAIYRVLRERSAATWSQSAVAACFGISASSLSRAHARLGRLDRRA